MNPLAEEKSAGGFVFLSGPETPQQEPNDGNQKGGQEIERLAILEVEEAEAAAGDHQTAHDEEFGHEGLADGGAGDLRNDIEHALPQKQHRRSQHHADAIGRGEDGAADEIEKPKETK